MIIEKSSKSIY